eukprot:3355670-Amphidinium_carterae.3
MPEVVTPATADGLVTPVEKPTKYPRVETASTTTSPSKKCPYLGAQAKAVPYVPKQPPTLPPTYLRKESRSAANAASWVYTYLAVTGSESGHQLNAALKDQLAEQTQQHRETLGHDVRFALDVMAAPQK